MHKSTTELAPKENRKHGDALFPLAVYHYSSPAGEPVLDCHWHEEAEFLVVLEGQTMFQIGTDYFPLQAGEAVFIHSGDIHAGHPLGEQGCRFFAIVFDMNWLSSGSRDRLHASYIAPLLEGARSLPRQYADEHEWSASVRQSLLGIRRDVEQARPGYELSVKAHLYSMLAELAAGGYWVTRLPDTHIDQAKLEQLKLVLAYIEANYQSKIYLKQLADMTHMDESQFCRFFKRLVHKSPITYINSYRVKQATLLLRSDRKMLDIALEVGFDNPSYFIKRFREEMHCTPVEFRRRFHL